MGNAHAHGSESGMIFADTIIISDLHLGSEVSRAPAALKMLKSASFNRLILLGDIFSDLNFRSSRKSTGNSSATSGSSQTQSAKSRSSGSRAIMTSDLRKSCHTLW